MRSRGRSDWKLGGRRCECSQAENRGKGNENRQNENNEHGNRDE